MGGNRRIAFIFPGQGSQHGGMGRELWEHVPRVRSLFQEGSEALGVNLQELCWEGSADQLTLTVNAQPAILLVSIAALEAVREEGVVPDYVAGHSLGEYSALVAAGALGLADALRTVRKRGEFMQEAVAPGRGAMAAILGAPEEAVFGICEAARAYGIVEVANLNAPGQVVVSGETEAVKEAVAVAKTRGAKARFLQVSAPFHCSLMRPAAERLAEVLRELSIRDPQVPLIANVDASPYREAAKVREALIRQVTSPVQWAESMRFLIREGVKTFVELGPGTVLSGLVKRIDRAVEALNVEDLRSLRLAVEALKGEGQESRSQ